MPITTAQIFAGLRYTDGERWASSTITVSVPTGNGLTFWSPSSYPQGDEPFNAARCKPILPPNIEHVHASLVAVDPRLDPADEAIAEDDRQHVPAPTALGRWVEELPDVLELEQAPEKAAIPDDRVEGGNERDGRRRVRWRFE